MQYWEGYLTSLKIIGFSYKVLIMIINKSLQWGDYLTDISDNHFGILELFLYYFLLQFLIWLYGFIGSYVIIPLRISG